MSLQRAIGSTLVNAFAGGQGTIRDKATPATAAKSVRVVVEPSREDADQGVSSKDVIVKIAGDALGSMNMTSAKTVMLNGKQYNFEPIPGAGLMTPSEAMTGNAPIVRGVLSAGGR